MPNLSPLFSSPSPSTLTPSLAGVSVQLRSGQTLRAGAVIITAPLGCLQRGDIAFRPALPEWKTGAMQRLGGGGGGVFFIF